MKKIINYFKLKYIENYDYKKIIIAIIIIFVAILSLFFSKQIEILLRLDYNFTEINNSKAQVHFLDVGQGDCVAIRFSNNETALIDCGAPDSEKKLTKYLDNIFFKNSNRKFDYAILTHTDSDHIGNFSSLLNKYEFNNIYLPKNIINHEVYSEIYKNIVEKNYNVYFNFEGISLNISDDSVLQWLSPTSNFYDNDNDYSPIINASINGFNFLFTGDASIAIENIVLMNYDISNIDVLKVGHHGSNFSTSYDLLAETQPQNIVFSVGENNYGHPSSEVIERIANYQNDYGVKINLYETKDKGNLIFMINNDLIFANIDNINRYFFIDWWIVVIIFILIYSIIFIVKRNYAINKVYQRSITKTKNNTK